MDTFLIKQSLDVLTMLGFIILVGIVVNNAILIIYQSLHNIRIYGMDYQKAIIEAIRVRIRPIYMPNISLIFLPGSQKPKKELPLCSDSSLTSLFGMLPLVLAPGAGSEIYRGLGAVILGGLALSTFLTIFLIPCLLSFFITKEKKYVL